MLKNSVRTSLFNVGYNGGNVTVRTFSRLCSIPSWTIYPIVQMYPALLFFDPGIFRWPKMLHICIRVTAPLDPIQILVTGTPNVKYIYPWQIPPKTIMILGHRQPKMLNIYPTRSQNPWLPVTQNFKCMHPCQIPIRTHPDPVKNICDGKQNFVKYRHGNYMWA